MLKRKIAGLLVAVMATGIVGTVVLADEGTYSPELNEYVEIGAFWGSMPNKCESAASGSSIWWGNNVILIEPGPVPW